MTSASAAYATTPTEEDGDFSLPSMAAKPEHNTPYLNCPLTTWTDLDIDALPIQIEDLNLPDVVIAPVEPVTESTSGSSGAKSDICQKSDVEEGDEEMEEDEVGV